MELTQRQKRIVKEMGARFPRMAERAMGGEKNARDFFEGLIGAGDIAGGDFDGPKNYSNEY